MVLGSNASVVCLAFAFSPRASLTTYLSANLFGRSRGNQAQHFRWRHTSDNLPRDRIQHVYRGFPALGTFILSGGSGCAYTHSFGDLGRFSMRDIFRGQKCTDLGTVVVAVDRTPRFTNQTYLRINAKEMSGYQVPGALTLSLHAG